MSTPAFAMAKYLITFDRSADPATIEDIQGRVRALSVETGNGEVRLNPNKPRMEADLSDAAAKQVRALSGVEGVWADVQFAPFVPLTPAPTTGGVTRVIRFDDGLSMTTVGELKKQIAAAAEDTGTGYCELLLDEGVVRANLDDAGVTRVRALPGVSAVEDHESK